MKNKRIYLLLIIGFIILSGCNNKKEVKFDAKLSSFTYSIFSLDNSCDYSIIIENEKYIYKGHCDSTGTGSVQKEIDSIYMDEIEKIIDKYKLKEWDGFNSFKNKDKEGEGFSISIGYDNGKNIYASGYMSFPKNYKEVHTKIVEVIEKIQNN